MKKVEISPSLMCMNLDKFNEEIEFLSKSANSFHIDIMDGHFVPNITLSPWFIEEVRKLSNLPLSIHLMVEDQAFWVEKMIDLKCEYICMHAEVLNGIAFRLIDKIHNSNLKAGIVLNPETPITVLLPYIELIDKVTIMTVDPGFAGERFLENTLEKIKELRLLREKYGYNYKIEMGGSSSYKTFKQIDEAGLDIYIVGKSGLFSLSENIEKSWEMMKNDYKKATGKDLKN